MVASLKHHRSRGFTLIEVMVALFIVGLALPALLGLIMTQLDGTVAVREKTYAYWVAENELTRIRLQQRLISDLSLPDAANGEVEQAGHRWRWEMIREATDFEGFYRVEVRVSPANQRGDGAAVASLLGFIDE